jgi:O-antigen ligase
VRESAAGRRRSGADGSGAPGPPQQGRAAAAVGALLLGGWAALACAQGGIDIDGRAGPGPTAAFLALLVAAPAAAWGLWRARAAPALRTRPVRLALGALCGLVIWTGVSTAWARAPDLAWIELNRTLLALAALVAGLALGALVPRASERLAVGLSLAAGPVVAWGLGSKVLPTLLGADGDPARLETPLGYSNALALVVVLAVPGVLWAAARPGAPRWAPPVAGAWTCAMFVTLLLTYSRGGLLALAVALAAVLVLAPWRLSAAVTALAAAIGAVLPAAYGLAAGRLTADGLLASQRRDAGLVLGLLLLVGMAAAAALAIAGYRLAPRLAARVRLPRPGRRGVIVTVVACVVVALGAVAVAAGEKQSGLGNDPGRIISLDSNHRVAWWGEAWRAFLDEPLAGSGAGSFPVLHFQERRDSNEFLNVRQPHQLALQLGAELGIVGIALMAALVAGVAWGARRSASALGRGAVAMPVAVAAAFLAQSQLDWTWSVPALTVAAMGAAGVLLAGAAGGSPAPAPGRAAPRARAGGALLGVATAAAVASALLPWWSGEQVASGQAALAAGRGRAALARAAEAHRLNPFAIRPLQLKAAALRATGDPAGELAALAEATRLQPDNPRPWADLAGALVRDGQPRVAAAAWTRVLALNPHAPPTPPGA